MFKNLTFKNFFEFLAYNFSKSNWEMREFLIYEILTKNWKLNLKKNNETFGKSKGYSRNSQSKFWCQQETRQNQRLKSFIIWKSNLTITNPELLHVKRYSKRKIPLRKRKKMHTLKKYFSCLVRTRKKKVKKIYRSNFKYQTTLFLAQCILFGLVEETVIKVFHSSDGRLILNSNLFSIFKIFPFLLAILKCGLIWDLIQPISSIYFQVSFLKLHKNYCVTVIKNTLIYKNLLKNIIFIFS